MAGTTPMSTLQQVKAWLATLTTGSSVDVSASLFQSDIVSALFALLPDADPIALTVTSVDAANATLTGTATVLGESGTTATCRFTQPASELALELTLTPPASVAWSLVTELNVTFGGLAAKLVPNTDLGVVGLDFAANVTAGTSGELAIPVDLSVPSFDGDWHLSAGTIEIGQLTEDALTAIAGNNSLTSILPSGAFQALENFKLTGLEIAFDPSKDTCSLIRVGLAYDPPPPGWTFFGGRFTVVEIDLDFAVLEPLTDATVQAELDAKTKIGSTVFDVGGRFPDKAVFANIAPDSELLVNDVFEFLHVPLPAGFPEIDITTLSFVFYTASNAFDFQLGIDKPIPLIGDAKLDSFFFEIGAVYDPKTDKIEPSGNLHSQFSFGETTKLLLGGSYATSGITLEGEIDDLAIGVLIAKLASEFGIESVPAPIEKLELDKLTASLDSAKKTFSFTCIGKTEFAGLPEVDFTVQIDLTYGTEFTAKFGGQLVLKTSAGKELEFEVSFSETHTDTWVTAEYKGTALGFDDLASAVDFPVKEPIPPALDLGLSTVGFYYDFTSGGLAFGAKSKTYNSEASLATLPIKGTRQYFFILDTGQSFSLSNLPLVGHELAEIEDVSISNLHVIIASATADGDTVKAVNDELEKLKSVTYPKLPATGTTGTLVVSASLALGTHQLPLNVSLGGAKQLPAPAGSGGALTAPAELPAVAATHDLAAANGGGVTWFNVQKSFGPVSINRIGVMYQSETQTLWFELDADLAFGPLTLNLVGLGIGSPLTSFKPRFSLQGLGVGYDKPPLQIAGGLVNLAPPGASYIEFEGGLTVGTSQFKLSAFGYYGNNEGFSSMFVFGDIGYPFGGPPAFFVTGVALGFGYNSSLRIPTIDEVDGFPFVVVLPTSSAPNPAIFGTNPTPAKVLEVIRTTDPPWVKPEAGSLWFAAGLTFTSFELVNGQALITVEAGDDLVIALVGVASAQFPQLVDQSSGAVFAHVELDILIRFAPIEGVFSAQAQLAKSSFVLDRNCVLTGGFAFFIWFGDNPHAGDFVLTLGGYNPGYKPPAHYPSVPAVGFHWSLSDAITISGGAYFAITPAVLMAGGRLEATYQAGNLKAWFDAHADVLIRWKPFWIDADIGITIGASYKVNLLFTSFTISVELGCELELWGPPTGGTVTFDWNIISFTIGFGEGKGDKPQIKGWSDIETMLPNTAPEKQSRNVVALTPADGLTTPGTSPTPQQAPTAGTAGDDPGAPWSVRGSRFAFETSTSIPATTASVGASHAFNGDTFDVHPLGWKGVSSTYSVTIEDSAGADMSHAFEATHTTRSVPASLWGAPPESSHGPLVPAADQQLVHGQILGVSIQVNPPELGATAGPIDVEKNLSTLDLELPGAQLPLSGSAQPVGDVPVNSPDTVQKIADPHTGIASTMVTSTRGAIYDALLAVHFVPAGHNDPLSDFSDEIDCALAAEPLLVS
ncbi:MAG: hypothetical protein QOF69_3892 [Solirubrobacteraceae bacterium]|nr:hypothetical protein [Solirubrobacteraceae bacterium]